MDSASPTDVYAVAHLKHRDELKKLRNLQRNEAPIDAVFAQLDRVRDALIGVERAEVFAFGAKARHSKPGKRVTT